MKWTISFLIIMMTLILSASMTCNTKNDENGNGNNPDTLRTISASGITLQWKPESTLLYVKIIAPTTGWVAVGFDPTQMMQDANIIIGYVRNDTVYLRDDYGSGPNSHNSDISAGGTDNITDKNGTENQTQTEISFKIHLNSGDTKDRQLVVGTTYKVILAYGENNADDFDSYHKTRAVFNIKI